MTRATVTARVSDPDDATATLHVRLQYNLSSSYQGTVTMRYDAGRNLFTYHLPAIEAHDVGVDGGHLSASVTATDPSGHAPSGRPMTPALVTVNGCGPTIGNP